MARTEGRGCPTTIARCRIAPCSGGWRAATLRRCASSSNVGSSVYALAYGIVIDPGEADEVVAATFAYVWLSAARFIETANTSVATWLGEITRSRARAVLLSREWAGGWSHLERAADFTT